MAHQWLHVGAVAGVEVIHTEDFVARIEDFLAQMRADETCSTGDQHAARAEFSFSSHDFLFRIIRCAALRLSSTTIASFKENEAVYPNRLRQADQQLRICIQVDIQRVDIIT